MKTYMANNQTINHKWYVVDAKGKTLGRLSTQVATVIMGKHKPEYTPHVDCGDYVIIVNADQVILTGNKWDDKIYRRHTGYNGGIREISAKEMMKKFPTRMVEKSIAGMLPKTKLGRAMASKLFVYAGNEHPHIAQQPENFPVE